MKPALPELPARLVHHTTGPLGRRPTRSLHRLATRTMAAIAVASVVGGSLAYGASTHPRSSPPAPTTANHTGTPRIVRQTSGTVVGTRPSTSSTTSPPRVSTSATTPPRTSPAPTTTAPPTSMTSPTTQPPGAIVTPVTTVTAPTAPVVVQIPAPAPVALHHVSANFSAQQTGASVALVVSVVTDAPAATITAYVTDAAGTQSATTSGPVSGSASFPLTVPVPPTMSTFSAYCVVATSSGTVTTTTTAF